MPTKTLSAETTSKVNARGEVLQIRSPAEFFAENQNIAGFDNPGKSLFTTIREFVENSLDAAESIHVLPEIELRVVEMSDKEFNQLRGVKKHQRIDHDLYSSSTGSSKKRRKSNTSTPIAAASDATTTDAPATAAEDTKSKGRRGETNYYKITCRDNGTGMKHEKIPDMLGRVLSGSKYGVRQTRGKFGLGAKMALIWAKKSTGMPIEVRSAHRKTKDAIAGTVSYCKLDIDIYKNEPNVLEHQKSANIDGFTGTEISVVIGGNWTTYKSRIVQYLQQLAIITPYAQFELRYECMANEKRSFNVRYDRRSDQMPALAKEVKHHPSALNDLLLKQLIDHSRHKTLLSFLTKELLAIDAAFAARVINELSHPFHAQMDIHTLSTKQLHQIVCLLKQIEFKAPDGSFLSPAGEYNLRLGVIKELDPVMIATHTESPAVFEGHSFIVEAAVSIGGKDVKEGLNVYRFANRIPLLFEAGGDVVTRTTSKNIKWSQYKIDHKREKVGIFVSIVSTKIPFKGTGKEYIGDDIPELKKAVKHVLQQCCAQLRSKILKSSKSKEHALRKKTLIRYIPDVSRAIHGVFAQMSQRRQDQDEHEAHEHRGSRSTFERSTLTTNTMNALTDPTQFHAARDTMLRAFNSKEITPEFFSTKLTESVHAADEQAAAAAAFETATKAKTAGAAAKANGGDQQQQQMFIVPLSKKNPRKTRTLYHSSAIFQFYASCISNTT